MKGNLVMTPENQQAFERIMDMLDNSVKEMRHVARNMIPEALVKFGLDTALKDFCAGIDQSGVLKVSYQSGGLGNTEIAHATAITIYRVVEELVNNIIRHADATAAIVRVYNNKGVITFTVADDGKGFDTAILQQPKGMGWSNIRKRVDFLKAGLNIESLADKGTTVLITFDSAKGKV